MSRQIAQDTETVSSSPASATVRQTIAAVALAIKTPGSKARSIEEMGSLRARFRREAEADLIELSIAIARRVLRRELAVDPEALHGLVLAALEKLQSQEIRRVKVHPSHAAMVAACLREAGGSAVEVVPDAAREPGAVVFETERGNLD